MASASFPHRRDSYFAVSRVRPISEPRHGVLGSHGSYRSDRAEREWRCGNLFGGCRSLAIRVLSARLTACDSGICLCDLLLAHRDPVRFGIPAYLGVHIAAPFQSGRSASRLEFF